MTLHQLETDFEILSSFSVCTLAQWSPLSIAELVSLLVLYIHVIPRTVHFIKERAFHF